MDIAARYGYGTNGDQVVVTHFAHLGWWKCDQGLGAARCGPELDLDGIGRIHLDDRAKVAALQTV